MNGELPKKPLICRRRQNPTLGAGSLNRTSPPIASTKTIPNYLKAPVSSCHDLCKYGHGHGSASTKWRPPVRPKQRRNSGIRGVVLNPELRGSGKKEGLKREEVIKENLSPPKEDIFVDKEATFVEDATVFVPRDLTGVELPEEKVFELYVGSSVCDSKVSDEEASVNSDPISTRFQDVSVSMNKGSSEDCLSMKVIVSHSDGMHDHALTCDEDLMTENPLSEEKSVKMGKVSDKEPSLNSDLMPTRSKDVPVSLDKGLSEDDLTMKVVVSHSDGMHDHGLACDQDLTTEIPLSEDKSVKMVKTKKNAKVTRINRSELHTSQGEEIMTKRTETEEINKVSFKPSATRKRYDIPKDGTVKKADTSVQPGAKEKRAMSLTNKPKISNKSTTKPKDGESEVKVLRPVKQPALVKPPIKSPRILKKRVGSTSSLENIPSGSGVSASSTENAKEKTIYAIWTQSEAVSSNPVKRRDQKGKLSSAGSESVPDKDRTSNRKTTSLSCSKPPLPPHKIAFRRGKVVNGQTETNVQTRLKFRHVKPGNVTNRGEGGTCINKVVRKKRDGGSFNGTRSTPPTGTPAAKLRHQDSPQDKNGAARSLFNHVIEETASKLAETRKSKVKALVGAFEAVISLQENSTASSS